MDREYVVDASVAFYGGAQPELFVPEQQALSIACSWFLTRASIYGAVLHVPSVFYSEVTTLVARDLMKTKVLDFEDGTQLLKDILGTNWEMHVAVFEDVLRFFLLTKSSNQTNEAEYLALTQMLNCTFITADKAMQERVLKFNLDLKVVLVTEHSWAEPGNSEDFLLGS
jgi:hypothetical protein